MHIHLIDSVTVVNTQCWAILHSKPPKPGRGPLPLSHRTQKQNPKKKNPLCPRPFAPYPALAMWVVSDVVVVVMIVKKVDDLSKTSSRSELFNHRNRKGYGLDA